MVNPANAATLPATASAIGSFNCAAITAINKATVPATASIFVANCSPGVILSHALETCAAKYMMLPTTATIAKNAALAGVKELVTFCITPINPPKLLIIEDILRTILAIPVTNSANFHAAKNASTASVIFSTNV